MRRASSILASIALAAAAGIAVAAPASADHYTELSADGTSCWIGGGDAGLFFTPPAGKVTRHQVKNGATIMYRCTFVLPVSIVDDYGDLWTRPTTTAKVAIQCARPEDGYWGPHRRSVLTIRPDGRATATCYAPEGSWPQ